MTAGQAGAEIVPQDQLFEALDGQALRVGDGEWRVQVYGVIDAAGGRWIQLALDGARHQVLTLRLGESEGPQHAVHALSSWLANPTTEKSDVLSHVA